MDRSQAKEAASPASATAVPAIQAITSWRRKPSACSTPMAAGMMRNAKTSSTPASPTELVTTSPKAA